MTDNHQQVVNRKEDPDDKICRLVDELSEARAALRDALVSFEGHTRYNEWMHFHASALSAAHRARTRQAK